MSEALDALGLDIVARMPGALGHEIAFGELTLSVNRADVLAALEFLKTDSACRFEQLIDLCGVDQPEQSERFLIVYHLLSMSLNRRIRIKIRTGEDEAVASATPVYPVAEWYEREAFDMYGIYFDNHPDLRRILTDYGFQGHPLRKDFPMTGYVELRYSEEEKRVVYEPVKIAEYRAFDFLSPWEGANYGPGDEKAGA